MSESNLLKISEVIPHEYVGVFPYETFNTMQSILFEQVFHTSVRLVPVQLLVWHDLNALLLAQHRGCSADGFWENCYP